MSSDHRKLLDFMKVMSKSDEQNYPETLKSTILINTPKVFSVFWKIIKAFLDPVVAKKIIILDSNYHEKLSTYFHNLDDLPIEFGGQVKHIFR